MFRMKVPPTVEFVDQGEKAKVSFGNFLFELLCQAKPVGIGHEGSKLGTRIRKRIDGMNGEPTVDFETDEYNTLRAVLPTASFLPHANLHFEEFYEAVAKAEDLDKKTPEKK